MPLGRQLSGRSDKARLSNAPKIVATIVRILLSAPPVSHVLPVTSPRYNNSGAYTDMMNRLADEKGEQFRPCQLMMDHAQSCKKFHS